MSRGAGWIKGRVSIPTTGAMFMPNPPKAGPHNCNMMFKNVRIWGVGDYVTQEAAEVVV